MATRFYFHGFTPPAVPLSPSVDSSWNDVGALARRAMEPSILRSVLGTTNTTAITVNNGVTENMIAWQLQSPPLAAQTIAGTVSLVIRCEEAATTANCTLAVSLRVLARDGTIRGTLFSVFGTDTEFPLSASSATRIVNAQAVTSVTVQRGDVLVLEIGARAAAPTATTTATLRVRSDNASDFALTSGLTTDLNPWMELSQNIVFSTPLPNNYRFVSVGDGMGTTEKIK